MPLADVLAAPLYPAALQPVLTYPLELQDGGLGVALTCTSTASAAQAITAIPGGTITVCNDGASCLWFRIGGTGVVATLACTPVLPGTKEVFTVPNTPPTAGVYPYTHISAITRSGTTTTGTANFGVGA